MNTTVRQLRPADDKQLRAFLSKHLDTSMLLLSNLQKTGLNYDGKTYEAEYFAAFQQDELSGVVAHAWHGDVLLQAPDNLQEALFFFREHSTRPVTGLIGPDRQVRAARELLDLSTASSTLDSCQDLFSLRLSSLVVPKRFASGEVKCRHARAEERRTLVQWKVEYEIEANGRRRGPALLQSCEKRVGRLLSDRDLWLGTVDENPVSMTSFNATLRDCVQVGGVYTPPELRRRGYAQCAVAASLLEARQNGVERAILFTDQHNEPARGAYQALGFQIIGDYRLLLFEEPQNVAFH